jgi:hypothetical protein
MHREFGMGREGGRVYKETRQIAQVADMGIVQQSVLVVVVQAAA